MAYIETLLTSISDLLTTIGPTISLIMLLLAGIVYAFAQMQPPESRGKWITTAMGLFVGGIIVAAVVGGATIIRDTSMQLLT